MSSFRHGLCGCFDDCGVALITYFCPCYAFGKNAEAVGDSCCLCGCAYLFCPIILGCIMRGKLREKQDIPGGCCSDLLTHFFCHMCALCQEGQEVKHITLNTQAMERE
ncbi:hypothetical protein BOX15_Mlig011077g1 [Macrostomum lignano]|uniref:Uncharacterized protein n=1 Tax=Macrostomum lignano TaxID=282301 RepID=A0A267G1B3_9PLAT|nr:hypothetical protein BOX15_Mlig011077g3 [Macrostomum lignano]PAA82031.1 hypothetical protein BOX15_Mlig011077g2 [Macrostomum lignano]PAA82048.1 hypothetical protein BOX15_Mlig011077g1 [Macrostomum lignano]